MSTPPRRWLELRVARPTSSDADVDAAGVVADALVELGARGVEERTTGFVAFYEEPPDPEAFVAEARVALASGAGLDDPVVEWGWQPHEEWAVTWRRGLGTRRITDRLVVRPSWIEPDDERPGDLVIVLDPGMAFGTAEHGTTRGSLRLLERAVEEGDSVLDVGAGSGILSIAAVLLGAQRVVAIEADPLACEALEENVVRNGVGTRVVVEPYHATSGDLAARPPVSGIVANIETKLLTPLLDGFRGALRDGGWLVVSGILEDEWVSVRAALEERGFRPTALDEDGEWRTALLTTPGARDPGTASPAAVGEP